MKKIHYVFYILILILFVFIINIFKLINKNYNYQYSINIIFLVNIILYITCIISINFIFKKSNLKENFKNNIKNAISNSFFISSSICIIYSIFIYSFLGTLLSFTNLSTGLINYCLFASKIWFVSAPFIGLELTIFKYFSEIDYLKTPIFIAILKLIIFVLITFLLYFKYPSNCILYAKPICDILFIFYYSKICFELSLRK